MLDIGVGGIYPEGRRCQPIPKKKHDDESGAACGCDAEVDGRKALAVDPDIKDSNLKRLRRIEGQIRGLHNMVEEDRYCADIITQISSVQEALRGVGRALMRNHLRHCATQAIRKGTPEEAQGMYDEILDLVYKHLR